MESNCYLLWSSYYVQHWIYYLWMLYTKEQLDGRNFLVLDYLSKVTSVIAN